MLARSFTFTRKATLYQSLSTSTDNIYDVTVFTPLYTPNSDYHDDVCDIRPCGQNAGLIKVDSIYKKTGVFTVHDIS